MLLLIVKKMIENIITLIIGVIAILILAEVAVRNTLKLATHFGWSGTFVGLTILSIGTSVPEIMSAVVGSINIVNDNSLLHTISGLVVGTNVGSDIFQQTFVLGLVGILGTIIVVKKDLLSEVGALIAGAALMWIMTIGGYINRLEGFIMFSAYMGYLVYLEKTQRKNKKKKLKHVTHRNITYKKSKKTDLTKKQIIFYIGSILITFIFMAFAANAVIDSSTILVSQLAISASFFGVLLLGAASALPELTTALIGIFKGNKGVSSGVLIGSNVTNPLMGLGLGAMISGYAIPKVTMLYDLPFKIGVALFIFYILYKHEKLSKWNAILLIGLFLGYLALRNIWFPVDF